MDCVTSCLVLPLFFLAFSGFLFLFCHVPFDVLFHVLLFVLLLLLLSLPLVKPPYLSLVRSSASSQALTCYFRSCYFILPLCPLFLLGVLSPCPLILSLLFFGVLAFWSSWCFVSCPGALGVSSCLFYIKDLRLHPASSSCPHVTDCIIP